MSMTLAPEGATNRKQRRAAVARRRCRDDAPPLANALSYTINDACRMVGVGRSKIYELAKAGRLRLIKVDGRSLITGDSLRALVPGQDA